MRTTKIILITVIYIFSIFLLSCQTPNTPVKMNTNRALTPIEKQVIVGKGTEIRFSGKYDKFDQKGTYVCRNCGAELYSSESKFEANCGWPAFDSQIGQSVKHTPDPDGIREEITCANCGAHLGHVFTGEGFTKTDTRHCVNSISMEFIPATIPVSASKQVAVFASGCFWGTQHWFDKLPGVISTQVGYAGGWLKDPTYKQVSSAQTGHRECIEVVFDPKKITYTELLRTYFNTHDPEQVDGQGPDKGEQYLSAIFYTNEAQHKEALELLQKLREKGIKPATEVRPLDVFYKEKEDYHQLYYQKTGKEPYCHIYKEII